MGCPDYLLAFASVIILIFRNYQKIREELGEFTTSKLAIVAAIFLAVLSAAFIAETSILWVRLAAITLTVVAVIVVLVFVFAKKKKPQS